jgi:VanZ family protein
MFHKLTIIAAWALLAFITYATIIPLQNRPTFPASTSFEHMAAFVALGTIFCIAYPRHIVFTCLVVLGSAVLLETFQLVTADRHGRIQDTIEKMAGGALGIAIGQVILLLVRARRSIRN